VTDFKPCRIFGASFFDNMMNAGKSSIDTLIEKEDCTIGKLLKEGELINECKWGNQKLIN